MIKAVGFDLGYTLVYRKREEIFKDFMNEFYGIEKAFEEIEIAYHLTDKQFMRHYIGVLGKNTDAYMPWYLGVLNYKLGLEPTDLIDQYHKLQAFTECNPLNGWHVYPFAIDVIETIKEMGYKVVLISNWDNTARSVLKELKLEELFDYITISSEVGLKKPRIEIFLHTLKAIGMNPHDLLYIGDNYYDDVEGAKALGINTLLINRFGRLGIEEISDCSVIATVNDVISYLDIEVNKSIGEWK